MTTIAFLPNNNAAPPFQTSVTLDGNGYLLTCTWNFFRAYWYVQLYNQIGALIGNQPLIGSPPMVVIPLFPGVFLVSTISFSAASAQFVITP